MTKNNSPTADLGQTETTPQRILLVDDHPTFRQGLRWLLSQDGGFTVCAEAENSAMALTQLRETRPDVVVLDVSLPGMNGLELIKMIRAESPRTPILVLSMHDESVYALRALKAGAKGYITKTEAMASIVAALHRVADGQLYVSPTFGEQLIFKAIRSVESGLGSPVDVLSDRELEVLELLGKGLSTRDIAEALRLSPKTVETHRAHMKEKLHLGDSSRLVRFAVDWVASGDLARRAPAIATEVALAGG